MRLGFFLFVATIINLLTSNFQDSKKKIEKLNQQIIQENPEQLRMALSAARMGMWNWNLVTSKIKWSPEHALLFSLFPDAFDGKYETFDASVHPDDRLGLNQAIKQALNTKTIYQHEFRVVWSSGSIHWLEGRGHGFYNDTNQAVRMAGTIVNIDDRKQTEILLHQQFEQQRLLVEMTQRIRQSLNLQDILQTTVEEVRRFLQCDRALMFKIDSDSSGIVLVESVDPAWNAISSNSSCNPCISKEYIEPFKQGLVTAKSDIYTAEIAPCHLEMLAGFQVLANLVVPILQGDNLWGFLIVYHCASPREWQDSEIELLRQLSAQASIALQQADLFEQLQAELRECKLAEIALQENEQKFQLFIKYAPASIAMFDREMCYVAASQRWVDEFHLNSIASIAGRSHYELFPNLPEQWKNCDQRGLAGFTEKCDEDFFVYSDGSQQWLRWEIHPWYRSNGDIGGIILFTENITDRKQAQIALQQLNIQLEQRVAERTAELTQVNDRLLVTLLDKEHAYQRVEEQAQLLEYLYNNAPCGYHSVDAEGTIVQINDTELNWFGYTRGEIVDKKKFIDLVTTESQSIFYQNFPLFKKQGWIQNLEFQTLNKDGSTRWISLNASAVKDEAGNFLISCSSLFDISDRKQVAAALLQKSRQEKLLWSITQAIRQSLDLNVILNTGVTEVRQTLQTDRAAIYRFNLDWTGDFVVESVGEDWVKLSGCNVKKNCEDGVHLYFARAKHFGR